MTKEEAIKWFNEITNGAGVDRNAALDVIYQGRIARNIWDEVAFTLGIEYGVQIALVKAFGITREDLVEVED